MVLIANLAEASRNGLASSLTSPGATSDQFKKELESTNESPPPQIPSGSSSIINLDGSALPAKVEEEEVRPNSLCVDM